MLGKSPSISASIYYRIGCGNFFFRPRAKRMETHQYDKPGKGLWPELPKMLAVLASVA